MSTGFLFANDIHVKPSRLRVAAFVDDSGINGVGYVHRQVVTTPSATRKALRCGSANWIHMVNNSKTW